MTPSPDPSPTEPLLAEPFLTEEDFRDIEAIRDRYGRDGTGPEVLTATFRNPVLKGYKVSVLADTVNPSESRLTTVIARFPRCILAEVNTHRVFSRNSASSRARSVKAVILDTLDEPYVPLFTSNQRGMSGPFVTKDQYKQAKSVWLYGLSMAVDTEMKLLLGDEEFQRLGLSVEEALDYYYEHVYNTGPSTNSGTESESGNSTGSLNIHKQNANRVLEPYMWHEALITSSYWENFLHLRADLDKAAPEIYALAVLVREALAQSEPYERSFHMPFLSEEDMDALTGDWSVDKELVLPAVAEAAGISYHDKSGLNKRSGSLSLGERLLESGHLSPFEHFAYYQDFPNLDTVSNDLGQLSGNLDSSWIQLRSLLAGTQVG